jgi:VWFA-related protein
MTRARVVSVAGGLAVAGIVVAHIGAAAQQKAPIFRSRVDLIQLDVTVLDKDGRPVRGLTKDDFTLLEDNTPQTIQGFTAIDLPDRTIGGPVWADRVAADVTSNEIENARIFVLVIDDGRSMGFLPPPARQVPDPAAVARMKEGAEAFLRSLGPLDLAAIVFTQRTKFNQNLTSDKRKLIDAIRAFPISGGGDLVGVPSCLGSNYTLGTIEGLVKLLSELPDRRKAIVYFGGVMPWVHVPGDDRCFIYWRWRDIFALAQQSSVTVNPVDTMGLRVTGTAGPFMTYGAVAENTGGRAVIGNNDLKPGLERIRIENSSYYLLAYQPTKGLEDGTFRRLTVRVKDRPDVEIVTRRNYWAPRARPADEPAPPPPPPEIDAMAGLLPKADLKLRATAAAFAVAGTERAVIALAVGVKQPPLMARTPETIELLIRAFTADGYAREDETQVIPIAVPAARAEAAESRYDVLARIEVPRPGRYEIRLSARSAISGTTGGVFVDVDVPNFRKDKVALSGLVLHALPAAGPVAPARALADLVPLAPATERTFAPGALVTSFLRVYQGGNDTLAPVTMKMRIANAADQVVFEHSDTLTAERFGDARAADYHLRLPLAELPAGSYLLSLEATLGKTVANREVVIHVQ